jgi:hypothetical protein
MRKSAKAITPVLILFVILNAFFIAGKSRLLAWNVDQEVLIIGNALLFVITMLSFWLAQKGLGNANPHAFVRSVYTSMMLKLFACIIAAFVYIAMNRDNLNKPALFTCMALYLVYTFMEVSILMKQLKGRANG